MFFSFIQPFYPSWLYSFCWKGFVAATITQVANKWEHDEKHQHISTHLLPIKSHLWCVCLSLCLCLCMCATIWLGLARSSAEHQTIDWFNSTSTFFLRLTIPIRHPPLSNWKSRSSEIRVLSIQFAIYCSYFAATFPFCQVKPNDLVIDALWIFCLLWRWFPLKTEKHTLHPEMQTSNSRINNAENSSIQFVNSPYLMGK